MTVGLVKSILPGCLLSVVLLVAAGCSPEGGPGEEILAKVGDRAIRSADFAERYQRFLLRTGATDNGQARRSMLNQFVSEALLIDEARHRGYDRDDAGRQELARIEIQELLNAYYQKHLVKPTTVSEEELYRLFVWANTRLKARHLYAPTRNAADSLYRELKNGRSFEELARYVFADPRLRENGGSLGYFTVDEMDPAFEEAAFGLNIGETSAPVRTSDGYSIIRVEDKIVKPILTEYEFAKYRPRLERYWRSRKVRLGAQSLVDSLAQSLEIRFNPETLRALFHAWQRRDAAAAPEGVVPAPDAELSGRELLRYRSGRWDVATFQQKARFTSARQQGWIRSEDRLRDFVRGLVVREHILQLARQEGLHRRAAYRAKVDRAMEQWLITRLEDTLYQEIDIPEDTLRFHYAANPEKFFTLPQIRLQEIVVDSESEAKRIASRLSTGDDFSRLAATYSVRQFSAVRGGDIGFVTRSELGPHADAVFSLSPGEWTGPIPAESRHFFFKCLEKTAPRKLSFAEARADIERTLRSIWWERVRSEKINEIRGRVPVAAHPKKLRNVRLN